MKKFLVLLLVSIIYLAGCSYKNTDSLMLKKEIAELEAYKISLEEEIKNLKEENNVHSYIIELTVSQSHFTFDIGTHIKDAINELTFEIPVSKEFYDSVEEGDILKDDFRMASLVLKGSFGSWEVEVTDKDIR